VTRGTTRRCEVGQGPGPTGWRWVAGTSPTAARAGARSAPRQGRAGATDGWPPCYSARLCSREPATNACVPQHSTAVRS
jgi:hypothetical protein